MAVFPEAQGVTAGGRDLGGWEENPPKDREAQATAWSAPGALRSPRRISGVRAVRRTGRVPLEKRVQRLAGWEENVHGIGTGLEHGAAGAVAQQILTLSGSSLRCQLPTAGKEACGRPRGDRRQPSRDPMHRPRVRQSYASPALRAAFVRRRRNFLRGCYGSEGRTMRGCPVLWEAALYGKEEEMAVKRAIIILPSPKGVRETLSFRILKIQSSHGVIMKGAAAALISQREQVDQKAT